MIQIMIQINPETELTRRLTAVAYDIYCYRITPLLI